MRTSTEDPGEAFRRLRETLGSLMYCRCRLEDAMADVLRTDVAATEEAGFGQQLQALRSRLALVAASGAHPPEGLSGLVGRLDPVRRRRNLIVHHLTGVSADPLQGEPHITCERRRGGAARKVRITQTELDGLLGEIERCRGDVSRVDGLTSA